MCRISFSLNIFTLRRILYNLIILYFIEINKKIVYYIFINNRSRKNNENHIKKIFRKNSYQSNDIQEMMELKEVIIIFFMQH